MLFCPAPPRTAPRIFILAPPHPLEKKNSALHIPARYNLARSKGRGGQEGGRARAIGFPAGDGDDVDDDDDDDDDNDDDDDDDVDDDDDDYARRWMCLCC